MLFAAQLSVDCFGICGTSCVLKRSQRMCKSIAESRLMFVAIDRETSGLRPRQDAYVHHVPQYTSGFHESMCGGAQLYSQRPRSWGRGGGASLSAWARVPCDQGSGLCRSVRCG